MNGGFVIATFDLTRGYIHNIIVELVSTIIIFGHWYTLNSIVSKRIYIYVSIIQYMATSITSRIYNKVPMTCYCSYYLIYTTYPCIQSNVLLHFMYIPSHYIYPNYRCTSHWYHYKVVPPQLCFVGL